MTKHKLPKHVCGYRTPWGKQVYYLRKPGRPKIRIQVEDDALPWSPAFLAALESAEAQLQPPADPKQIVDRPPVAGTVNAALIGYYQSEAFQALGETTRQNRRAILERLIRAEHGDKRTITMHAKAVQAIASRLKPNVQRNFRRAMQHFVRYYCLPLGLMTANPIAGLELTPQPKSKGFHAWTDAEIDQYRAKHKPGTKARLALEVLLQTGHARSDVVRPENPKT